MLTKEIIQEVITKPDEVYNLLMQLGFRRHRAKRMVKGIRMITRPIAAADCEYIRDPYVDADTVTFDE